MIPEPGRTIAKPLAVLIDVDGTLVDTVYHHTLAWQRALREHGVEVPAWVLHRHIGMGGDQLVRAVAGDDVERRTGDAIRSSEDERYGELLHEARPVDGAKELLRTLKAEGMRITLATSSKPHELEHYLDVLDARDVLDDWTQSDDVERTKPDPQLIEHALERIGGPPAVMLGDATWDCIAAVAAGISPIGVLTGGFSSGELREAGAVAVVETLEAAGAFLQGWAAGGSDP